MENICDEIYKTIKESLPNKSEAMADIEQLKDILSRIPSNIQDTELAYKVNLLRDKNGFKSLNKKNNNKKEKIKTDLWYEDILWILDSFDTNFDEAYQDYLKKQINADALHSYIEFLIESDNIRKREKVVLLLSCIEPLVYKSIEHEKIDGDRIKSVVNGYADHESKMDAKSIGILYITAITNIIFFNTNNIEKDNIDNRIPFRNHILHNGIFNYEEADIEIMYDILAKYIACVIEVETHLLTVNNER